jgi:hypothetical protein
VKEASARNGAHAAVNPEVLWTAFHEYVIRKQWGSMAITRNVIALKYPVLGL